MKRYRTIKELQESIKELNNALAADPNNAIIWVQKGDAHFEYREYAAAIKCYERALNLDPTVNLQVKLGVAYYQGGYYAKAIASYAEALKSDPTNADLWYHKGEAHYVLEECSDAINCYSEALKYDPTNADIWYSKGLALYQLGAYPEANACYDAALENDSDKINRIDILYEKAQVLVKLEGYQEALPYYSDALDEYYEYAVWNDDPELFGWPCCPTYLDEEDILNGLTHALAQLGIDDEKAKNYIKRLKQIRLEKMRLF